MRQMHEIQKELWRDANGGKIFSMYLWVVRMKAWRFTKWSYPLGDFMGYVLMQ